MNIRIIRTNISTRIADWNNVLIVNVTITLKNHANMNDAAQLTQAYIMTAYAQRRLKDESALIAMKIILFNRFNTE